MTATHVTRPRCDLRSPLTLKDRPRRSPQAYGFCVWSLAIPRSGVPEGPIPPSLAAVMEPAGLVTRPRKTGKLHNLKMRTEVSGSTSAAPRRSFTLTLAIIYGHFGPLRVLRG